MSELNHYVRTGRPFPRNVYRVLLRVEQSPVTNRALSHSLLMTRQMAGSYLSRCLMRGYLFRSGNVYQLSAAGRHRVNWLRQNDPDAP